MSKIYNEIVIDMNPESHSYMEVLHEDSFEYEGDMMLMRRRGGGTGEHEGAVEDPTLGENEVWIEAGTNEREGRYWYYKYSWNADTGQWTKVIGTHDDKWLFNSPMSLGEDVYEFGTDPNSLTPDDAGVSGESELPVGERDIGVPALTSEDWFGMDEEAQARYILDTKYGAEGADSVVLKNGETYTIQNVLEDLRQQPLLGDIDPTKAGFITEEYGGAGPDGILGTEDDVSFADSLAGQAAGLTYGTAGRTYEAAGLSWEGAEQTFGESLGALQRTAVGQATATGSSGIGMRAKIGQQKLLGQGFESALGTRGRAEDVYDIAGRTHVAAGDAYSLAEQTAGLDYRKGMYGLEYGPGGTESQWESSWQTFFNTLPEAA